MSNTADSAEVHELWLAKVEISIVNAERDKAVRTYLIAAPDRIEAEYRLSAYCSPGSLKRIIGLEQAADNIARVYSSDGGPLDVATVADPE